jgi:hypothetical protein
MGKIRVTMPSNNNKEHNIANRDDEDDKKTIT